MTKPAGLVVHLKARDATGDLRGRHLRLYKHLSDLAAQNGISFEIRQRAPDIRIDTRTVSDDRFDDGNLHILDDRSVQADNVLNAGAAYFWGFWHLDAAGTKAFSSIGAKPYVASDISWTWAKPFFDRLRDTYVTKRISKYAQAQQVTTIHDGCIAVFCQGDHPQRSGTSAHSDLSLVHAVLDGAGDRPVVVKPHPMSSDQTDIDALHSLADQDARLSVTQANVHDILSACAATASHNSTVALEGFLHRKPAVLFGISDFHHMAHSVSPQLPFADAFAAAQDQSGGYARYMTWYFKRNCLWLSRASLDSQIWKIFEQAGFPKSRFLSPDADNSAHKDHDKEL